MATEISGVALPKILVNIVRRQIVVCMYEYNPSPGASLVIIDGSSIGTMTS